MNELIAKALAKIRAVYGANSPVEREYLERNLGIASLPEGGAPTAGAPEPVREAMINPGAHSMRAEDGPTYGHPMFDPGQAQRFRPMVDPGQAQRFRPMPESQAQRAVMAARQVAAQQQPAATAEQQPQSNGLMRLVRGDFREGADQRIMEAMRRQQEESGVQPKKAEGGAATGKGQNARDAALHKALEIIHMMLSRH